MQVVRLKFVKKFVKLIKITRCVCVTVCAPVVMLLFIRSRKSTETKWFASNGKVEGSVQIRAASVRVFSVRSTVATTNTRGVQCTVVGTRAVTVYCTAESVQSTVIHASSVSREEYKVCL